MVAFPRIENIDFQRQDDSVPIPLKWVTSIRKILEDLNSRNGTLCIEWDPDIDGCFAGYCSYRLISKHYPNIKILNYIHSTKVHGVNEKLLHYCLSENVDVLLCVDCGSSDYGYIKELTAHNKKVIISDHHLIDGLELYNNDSNVVLANATLIKDYEELSGALMTLYLMAEVTGDYNLKYELIELGVVTIISDICETNTINKRIMLNYTYGFYKNNPVITKVQGSFNVTRNYLISFGAKLNSLIRYYGPKHLMDLLLRGFHSLTEIDFKAIKKLDTERIKFLQEYIQMFEFSNILVAVINEPDDNFYRENNVRNYIGILANKLTSKYQKLAIVMMPNRLDIDSISNSSLFTYSARDYYNRGAIELFDKYEHFVANGHSSAFGGKVSREFDFNLLTDIDRQLSSMKSRDYERAIETDNVTLFIRENYPYIAKLAVMNNIYREQFFIEGFIQGYTKSKTYCREIISDGFTMKSFDFSINLYSKVRVIPIFSGREIEYIVEKCK